MSLTDYAGLKDAVRRWSKRKDATDDFIDDFIDLAEQTIYSNEVSPLRIKEMDTRATATVSITDRYLDLPDLFIDMRRFKINAQTSTTPGFAEDIDIRFRAPDQLLLNNLSGFPGFFSITNQIEFERIPDQLYIVEMQYFAKELPLDTDNPINAVLTRFPSIYLHATLSELWKYYNEEEKAEFYNAKALAAIVSANKAEKKAMYGNAPQIHKERSGP